MNFRTTLILIVLLAAVGAVLLFTRDKSGEAPSTDTTQAPTQAKLIPFDAAAVTKLSITPSDDKPIVLTRDGINWQLIEPVKAPAETSTVSRLVESLVGLQSKGTIAATGGAESNATGLDKPHFKIELTTKDGKAAKLNIGERAATGNKLYVQLDGSKNVDLVSADVYEDLDKPVTNFRRMKLFDLASTAVRQLRIATPDSTIELKKPANEWEITAPTAMPAEESAVSDLLMTVTSLQANEFVSEKVDDPHRRRLDSPQLSVSFSTEAPSTQPASQPATQPSMTTVKFGAFTDVTKKNVFAEASDSPVLMSISASTIDSLKKKPLDLRDKRAVTIDPEQVSRISIVTDRAATTQPTTREASRSEVLIERSKAPPVTQPIASIPPMLAATAPTTLPSTMPATSQAATQPSTEPAIPSVPPSKWQIISTTQPTDAGDSKVDALLSAVHPLRVEKYLESTAAPTTQPAERYTVTIETIGAGGVSSASHVITLVDPGNSQPVIGTYNGLTFEVSRTALDAVRADFSKSSAASVPVSPTHPPE